MRKELKLKEVNEILNKPIETVIASIVVCNDGYTNARVQLVMITEPNVKTEYHVRSWLKDGTENPVIIRSELHLAVYQYNVKLFERR